MIRKQLRGAGQTGDHFPVTLEPFELELNTFTTHFVLKCIFILLYIRICRTAIATVYTVCGFRMVYEQT